MRFVSLRRPKFGLRFLLVLPVTVATYFVMAGPTKRFGLRDVERFVLYKDNSRQPARYHSPLLITVAKFDFSVTPPSRFSMQTTTTYYLWLLGYVVPLHESIDTDAFVKVEYEEPDPF